VYDASGTFSFTDVVPRMSGAYTISMNASSEALAREVTDSKSATFPVFSRPP